MTNGNACISLSPRHRVSLLPLPFTDHCISISYRHLITILPFLLVQNNWGYSPSLQQILAFLETYIPNHKTQLQGLQGINTENIFPLDGGYRFKQGVIETTETTDTSPGQESGIHMRAYLSIASVRGHVFLVKTSFGYYTT
jgi:hypothetical protein